MPADVVARARTRFDVTHRDLPTPMGPDHLRTALRDYDAVLPTLGDLFKADVFADVPKPRAQILANFGVGYNHIDVTAARAAGLSVTNTPGAVTDATADIALMLILMTARRAGEGERLLRSAQWTGWHPTQMLGMHVSGRTVGIIGMGRIGKAIAQRCHFGFGMKVIYHNRSAVDAGLPATQLPLHQVLQADIVVIAVPGGHVTHHLISTAQLAQMRPEAFLINIARGDVVDEAALVAALQNRQIAGAGLDVYVDEPNVPAELRKLDNVVLTPHVASGTVETRKAMSALALANLDAHMSGKPVITPVPECRS